MARIRRWKETLVVACVTLFFALARAWPLRPRDAAGHHGPEHSLLLTGTNRKTAFGVELMAQRPYIRLARASLVPVAMPLVAGAYTALAAAPGGPPAEPLPEGGSTCPVCNAAAAPCCSVTCTTWRNVNRPHCYTFERVCPQSSTLVGYWWTTMRISAYAT
jgi:hypothetical protein